MSGIAEVLLNLGYAVSGSDLKESDVTKRLASLGAEVHVGHAEDNVREADVVVMSSAISSENPEVHAAHTRGIPVIPRGEMLAELMRMKYGIAIAGSHGKTTVTSMVATVLAEGELDPTAVIGGKLDRFGSNAKLGQGDLLVAEADESDGSFLLLSPTVAVVTNIDPEHLDHYGTTEHLIDAFGAFANKVPFYGVAVLCLDDGNVQRLMPAVRRRVTTYGLSKQAEYRADQVRLAGWGSTFTVINGTGELGEVSLQVPGIHNVVNALAAIAVARELDVSFDVIQRALGAYGGLRRRFERRGEAGGVTVVDDYGHHPTEIRATLAAARVAAPTRIVAVFQPHRYTRTRDLFDDFMSCFNDADRLVMTEIYPGGETPIAGVTGRALFDAIVEHGVRDGRFIENYQEIPAALAPDLQDGDMVLLLGAGSIGSIAPALLAEIGKTRT